MATNLKVFDEAERADAAAARHEAEGRVRQQLVEVPPEMERKTREGLNDDGGRRACGNFSLSSRVG